MINDELTSPIVMRHHVLDLTFSKISYSVNRAVTIVLGGKRDEPFLAADKRPKPWLPITVL